MKQRQLTSKPLTSPDDSRPIVKHRFARAALHSFALLLSMAGPAPGAENPFFPAPDIIKGNVAFWKKIYAEVSVQEGLLHDRDYPLVIFEKIDLKGIQEINKSDYVEARKKSLADTLILLQSAPDSALSGRQRSIKTLYSTYAAPNGIKGAEERIRFQPGQKERFRQGVERSFLYMDTISAILKSHGLPDQLKYLPHVESSFDPEAYSRVGAAGLWQFMRGTGKLFLKINYDIDERLDPIKSTEAASRLLKLNYRQLQSWPLAITAYNYGLTGMRKAVASTQTSDFSVIIQKHESPLFKFASKNFYASFIAASQLADSAEDYFKDLIRAAPVRMSTFTLKSDATAATLYRKLGISNDEFKKLNPSLRPVVFAQQKTIPAGSIINIPFIPAGRESVLAAAMTTAASMSAPVPAEENRITEYYTVCKGDNLHSISRKYGLRIQRLASFNAIAQIHRIYEGQILRLPPRDTATVGPVETQVTAASPPTATMAPESLQARTIMEEESQTAAAYADSTTAPAPIVAPRAPDSALVAITGDQSSGKVMNVFDAGVYSLDLEITPDASSAIVQISFDESIGRLAEWMNVPVDAILRLNELNAPRVKLGQRISIPIRPRSNVKRFGINRLEYHMAIEEDFFFRYQIAEVVEQPIKPGDNFWKLCYRNQIPLWLFKKHNRGVDLMALKPGMKIGMPTVNAKSIHVPPAAGEAFSGDSLLGPQVLRPEVSERKH
jgi:membrane-bound lytic murein transglycosylase D